MKRGEVWTVSDRGSAGKPRPCAIVQDDRFDATGSIAICAFTSDETAAPHLRLRIEPDERNGLRVPSCLMVDRVTTVQKDKLGNRIGVLSAEDTARINRALLVFLGLA
jgi:mRNA interferase MazF